MKFKSLLSTVLAASVILLSATLPASAEDRIRELGDVNSDGKITVADSVITLKCALELIDLNESDAAFADYNKDGSITVADATLIMKKSIGAEDKLTVTVPSSLSLHCGDRSDLGVMILPENKANSIKITYSTDGAISSDGSGEPVVMITNLGKIKAHHPGKSVVTVKVSNGQTFKCTVTVTNETTTQTVTVGNNSLNITKKLMTRNDCYNVEEDYNIKGIVVHSTATPGVKADQWYSMWNLSYEKGETDREVCVHAFLDDTGVYQYLPYEQVGWHVGGKANRSHIGFEICEPSGFYYYNNIISGYNVSAQQPYFDRIWKNATTYCAYLCNEYDISVDNIISHKEANSLGLGTAHGDPDHWFILHRKTMNDFRNSVNALMNSRVTVSSSSSADSDFVAGQFDAAPSTATDGYDMFRVWGDNSRSLRD